MKRLVFWLALLIALGAAFPGVEQASAQKPAPSDNEVNAVAHELYCPVCENIPLDVCPTQACAQWRDLIRQKLAAGSSKQQIEDYFAAQYGDRVLAVPPFQRAFNQLLPVLIAVGLLIGVGLVILVLKSTWKPRPAPVSNRSPENQGSTPEAPSEAQVEYLKRIEDELKRRA